MKIKPLGNIIQLKIEDAHAGSLDMGTVSSAIEYGEVVAVGEDVTLKVKKGDKLFFKSWAVDIITHEEKKYHFINPQTGGILAVVTE